MTGYVPAALQALEERAGASDTERAQWMEERAHAATATAIRDVWLAVQAGKTVEAAAEQVARKRLVDRGGAGPEAAWGVSREPHLVASIPGMRAESRVFSHPTEPRWKASPDGVAFDFDEQLVLAEVKTGAPRFFGEDAMRTKGYHVQMAWAMFIAEAVGCEYRFEERLGTRASGFEVGAVFAYTLRWEDVARLVHDELVPMARALTAAIDSLLEAGDVEVNDEWNSLAMDVLHGREIEAEGAAIKDPAWAALLKALPSDREVEQESGFARVKWTPGKPAGTTSAQVVDEEHEAVIAARAVFEHDSARAEKAIAKQQAVIDRARAALEVVEAAHTKETTVPTAGSKGRLTVSDPQKRKAKA